MAYGHAASLIKPCSRKDCPRNAAAIDEETGALVCALHAIADLMLDVEVAPSA